MSLTPLFLATIGAFISGAALELGARALIRRRRRYAVYRPGLRMRMQLDRVANPELEAVVRFETNRLGERGGEWRDEEAALRILVVGGSAAECYCLDQDSAWPALLETRLAELARERDAPVAHVRVGSIAKSGVDAPAAAAMLERVLPRRPRTDLVLLMVGASDVLRWLRHGAPEGRAAPPVELDHLFERHPERAYGWSPRRTALRDLCVRGMDRWRRPVVRTRVGKWMTRARRMRAEATEVREETPSPAAMLDAFEAGLRRCAATAHRQGVRLVVLRQPWFEKERFTADEESRFWEGGAGNVVAEQVRVFYSSRVIGALMRAVDERAVAVAESLGVPAVGIREHLEPSLDTFYDRVHLAPAGARAVATIVARFVADMVMPPRHATALEFDYLGHASRRRDQAPSC